MIGQGANDPRVKQAGEHSRALCLGSSLWISSRECVTIGCRDGDLHQRILSATESDQIFKAAKAKGLDIKYYLYTDEGHGFARPSNRCAACSVADVVTWL